MNVKDATIKQLDPSPVRAVGWFMDETDLRTVSPTAAALAEHYVVMHGDDIIAMALVDGKKLYRLAVVEKHRGRGVGEALVDHILESHPVLLAECRLSLDANGFYAYTGWEYEGITPADPESLINWRMEREG